MPKGLNQRQAAFAEFIVQGMAASRAYKEAGYEGKGNTAESKASRLVRNGKVASYIEELRGKIQDSAIYTSKELQKDLTKMMKGAMADDDRTGFSALATQLCKIQGLYQKETVDVNLNAGGVLVMPMAGSIEEWNGNQAGEDQKRLMDDAIDV